MVNGMREEAEKLAPWLTETRRQFHRHPELGFAEKWTTAAITRILQQHNVKIIPLTSQTGVVGLIEGAEPGPTVAVRADMDALPIQEQSEVPYKSEIPGVMHACGHDAHMTCALGAAVMLASRRHNFRGNIKLIFQPAEEINAGAQKLVKLGVMENPTVEAILGLHVNPEIPAGKVAIKEGPLMAAVDTIKITVNGVGGHGAVPHRAVDPIVAASAIVMGLQTAVSRNISPLEPAVVSICTFHGGQVKNVIPEKVEMTGTARSFSRQVREQLPEIIRRVVEGIAGGYGATAKLEYIFEHPAVENDAFLTAITREAAGKVLGKGALLTPVSSMGGEDFSLYLEKAPGCFIWLGVGNEEKGYNKGWHHPQFDIDESALPLGAALLAQAALDTLEHLNRNSQYKPD